MSNINKLGGDNRPTISVIMPCCKSEKYIEAAVKDLLAQTYSDWELSQYLTEMDKICNLRFSIALLLTTKIRLK